MVDMWHAVALRNIWMVVGLVLCFLTVEIHSDGCYEVERDVEDELNFSADVCSIRDALERSPPDFVTAEAYYKWGYDAEDPTLKELANGEFSGNYTERAAELFGDQNWMNKRLQEAFDGKGDFDTDVKRVQFIKKILQASLLGARLFSNLEKAYKYASRGRRGLALTSWERALADQYGKESDCGIFHNGQARGIEFNTMEKGVSAANDEIGNAFGRGGRLLKAKRMKILELRKTINIIENMYIVIYLQAVAKYATHITFDKNTPKAVAEGYAYYHAIAPFVYHEDSDAHDTILDCFDINAKAADKKKAETVLDLIPDLLKTFKIEDYVFGEYDEEKAAEYEKPDDEDLTCEAFNPFDKVAAGTFHTD